MKEYQTQIKEAVKKAVEEVIKRALKDRNKSKTRAAHRIWMDWRVSRQSTPPVLILQSEHCH